MLVCVSVTTQWYSKIRLNDRVRAYLMKEASPRDVSLGHCAAFSDVQIPAPSHGQLAELQDVKEYTK